MNKNEKKKKKNQSFCFTQVNSKLLMQIGMSKNNVFYFVIGIGFSDA